MVVLPVGNSHLVDFLESTSSELLRARDLRMTSLGRSAYSTIRASVS
jgi:hypothetical protein